MHLCIAGGLCVSNLYKLATDLKISAKLFIVFAISLMYFFINLPLVAHINKTNVVTQDKYPNYNLIELLPYAFITIIIAPLVEEFVFRNIPIYILNRFTKKESVSLMICLIQSFIFALAHKKYADQNLYTFFFLGVLCWYIAVLLGRQYNIIFHALYNMLWLLLIVFVLKFGFT
ncbi:CPBP family intramembrane glutamic endopeptidase [Deinococcus puniceus]|uniref:CPBP family intramembrane glutamic endopeptidase n=1 Tax=Deinococcus puniceus TaxID=1182568 RepID=UPI0009EEB365